MRTSLVVALTTIALTVAISAPAAHAGGNRWVAACQAQLGAKVPKHYHRRWIERDPRRIGCYLAALRGWTGDQWRCLNALWDRESSWQVHADNPSSDAYGIPQALPGWKMGPGWQDSPWVQIRWGLGYIAGRYGTPCGADSYQRYHNYY